MKISERELFQHVMMGFMMGNRSYTGNAQMDYRTTDADRSRV